MPFHIFGKVQNQLVAFVGCSKGPDIPTDSILLQVVAHHPELHWVKWSVRFRRTLRDKKALDHPLSIPSPKVHAVRSFRRDEGDYVIVQRKRRIVREAVIPKTNPKCQFHAFGVFGAD